MKSQPMQSFKQTVTGWKVPASWTNAGMAGDATPPKRGLHVQGCDSDQEMRDEQVG